MNRNAQYLSDIVGLQPELTLAKKSLENGLDLEADDYPIIPEEVRTFSSRLVRIIDPLLGTIKIYGIEVVDDDYIDALSFDELISVIYHFNRASRWGEATWARAIIYGDVDKIFKRAKHLLDNLVY